MRKMYRLTIAVVIDNEDERLADRATDTLMAEKWVAWAHDTGKEDADIYPDFGKLEVLEDRDNGPTFYAYTD